MLLLTTIGVAHALPPDHLARLWKVGDGTGAQVERLAVSHDGTIVAGRTRGNAEGWFIDVETWTMGTFGGPSSPDACSVTGVAPIPMNDGSYELWIACEEGKVVGKRWDGEALGPVLDAESAPIVFDAVDTTLSSIWYDPTSQLLYAAASDPETYTRLHVIDPFGVAVDAAVFPSYPKNLAWPDFIEGAINGGYLIVSHGPNSMSSIQLGVDGAVAVPGVFTGPFTCNDLAPSPLEFGGVYCVDWRGTVADYRPITNIFNVLALGPLIEPKAVVANDDLSDGWIAVTGTQVRVWEMDENGGIPTTEPYFEGPEDAENPIQDMVASEGYLFGGGAGGNLHVVTARPWVYPNGFVVEPTKATDGDVLHLSFQVDQDANWVMNIGGNRYGGGVRVAEGSTPADTDVTVELTVDDRFAEGDNRIYVIATHPTTLLDGHAAVTVEVDNPPDPPALADANLLFGDGELTLSFDGIPDEDLSHYLVYVTEAPFAPADWPTGGPKWDGGTRLRPPLRIDATGGQHVSHRIAPLENGVTYHVAVRAHDQGGKEGPMSRVIKGTPQEVYNASQLAGDPGGTPCSTAPAGWLAALPAAALVALRRRRGLLGVAAALLLLPALARAQQADEEDPWWKQDTTPTRADFEMRYGVIALEDERINRIYDQRSHDLLFLEIGPQFFHVVELDLGFGFFQDLSNSQSATGQVSGTRTMLTWWPFSLDGTLRAHFIDEQPLVPFARYGWDYVIWSEKYDEGATKAVTRGGKFGTHYALGLNVLLDVFQPGRASFLEARTGINDSWVVIEWRRQRVDAREWPWSGPSGTRNALSFGGDAVTVGLKLDW